MAAQECECTEYHCTVHLEMVKVLCTVYFTTILKIGVKIIHLSQGFCEAVHMNYY